MMGKVNQKVVSDFMEKQKADNMIKATVITFLKDTGIGQKTLIMKNQGNIKDLIVTLKKVESAKDKASLIKDLESTLKGTGWNSAHSLGSFSAQLKADQRIMLSALLESVEGSKLLFNTLDHLLNNYVYTS